MEVRKTVTVVFADVTDLGLRIAIEGDVDAEVRGRQLRAKTLARSGRHKEAESLANEAVRLAARTDYLDSHAQVLLSLAEVLRLASRKAEAASAVREAIELHRQKGNVVGEARAASLLVELEGGIREHPA